MSNTNFINVKFPIQDDRDKNLFLLTNQTTIESVKSNIFLLLTTQKGERYFNPEYGTNLKKFLFEPNDQINFNLIDEDIRENIARFIPYVQIPKDNGIIIQQDPDNRNVTLVQINFTYSRDGFIQDGTVEVLVS